MLSTKLTPSYHGYVGSTKDALLIIQSIINKQLNLIPRRPHERERNELIQSGNVFIFVEEQSGIKRWTDGMSWLPSRILGRFLVYRELDKDNLHPDPEDSKRPKKKRKLSLSTEDIEMSSSTTHSHQHGFKDQGLIKKTLSITTSLRELNLMNKEERQTIHLISYYNANDVLNGKLVRPSELDLKHVPIHTYLWNAIKESNLGGKIPIEDEAYYFLDNNYQLQNMSMLNNQALNGSVAAGGTMAHHGAHHGPHNGGHNGPGLNLYGPAASGAKPSSHSGIANGSVNGLANGHPNTNGSNAQAGGPGVPPGYNKSNFMLPLPSNYDYYNVNLAQKYDTNDDISFINPFTSNATNFNLSSNLNTFYHDQFQAPQAQPAGQAPGPQHTQAPGQSHHQSHAQPQAQHSGPYHSQSYSSGPSQSSSISTIGSVNQQQPPQNYPFPQYFYQDYSNNKKPKWNDDMHSHLHPVEDHPYVAYNT